MPLLRMGFSFFHGQKNRGICTWYLVSAIKKWLKIKLRKLSISFFFHFLRGQNRLNHTHSIFYSSFLGNLECMVLRIETFNTTFSLQVPCSILYKFTAYTATLQTHSRVMKTGFSCLFPILLCTGLQCSLRKFK